MLTGLPCNDDDDRLSRDALGFQIRIVPPEIHHEACWRLTRRQMRKSVDGTVKTLIRIGTCLLEWSSCTCGHAHDVLFCAMGNAGYPVYTGSIEYLDVGEMESSEDQQHTVCSLIPLATEW